MNTHPRIALLLSDAHTLLTNSGSGENSIPPALIEFSRKLDLTVEDIAFLIADPKTLDGLKKVIDEHRAQQKPETASSGKAQELSLYDKIQIASSNSFEISAHLNLKSLLSNDTQELLGERIIVLISRVEDGSKWLDQHVGHNWFTKIKTDILFLGSTDVCVLSQVGGRKFGVSLDNFSLTLEKATALGLHPGDPAALTDPIGRALTIIWLTKIKMLRPPREDLKPYPDDGKLRNVS